MASLKEFTRVVNGLSLVAKEIGKRSKLVETARRGDVEGLVRSTAKSALVSATDLVGLTSGTVRELSGTIKQQNSVVYFENAAEASQPNLDRDQTRPIDSDIRVSNAETVESAAEGSNNQNMAAGDETGFSSVEKQNQFDVAALSASAMESEPQSLGENANARFEGGTPEVTLVPLKRRKPRERKVPSTPFSRAIGFAGLAADLAWGTVQESTKRIVYGTPQSKDGASALSPFLSDRNAERLALALCRMRGAALKIGQMLSIQDESLVPAPILAALDIVRQGADVMPRSQLDKVLTAELGPEWSSKLSSFDYEPLAAASIGQVHRAVTKDGLHVAMKIQYPGVADSIDSDIDNVKLILDYTNLIPEGLYLDRAIKVAKEELSRECDYEIEAANQKRFRDLVSGMKSFYVPLVVDELSCKRVLTSELVAGITIDKVALLDQTTRDYVGRKLLELTLMELFVFRFMQTDPNWGNFLYEETTKSLNLIDFGAAREYPKRFVDDYLRMVVACANEDRNTVIEMSKSLGFLTGMESEVMIDAHVQAGFIVGLPFSKPGGYDFSSTNITRTLTNLGATMLRHRLTPPPDEVYSLHRKLSGAFLGCIKLGATVPCREMLLQVYESYQFGEEDGGEKKMSSG